MNLTQILTDAAAGFVTGVGLGAAGVYNKYSEGLDEIEAVFSEEEITKDSKLTRENREKLRELERRQKNIFPSFVGFCYSAVSSLILGGHPFERTLVSVPAIYVGSWLGRGLRRLGRRSKMKDLRVLRELKENPEELPDSISKDTRQTIEQALGKFEKLVLGGKCPIMIAMNISDDSPVKKIYDTIVQENRVYTPALMNWSMDAFMRTYERARWQRTLTDYFENQGPSCAIIGPPENLNARLFELNGKNFAVYSVKFGSLRKIDDETKGVSVIDVPKPKIEMLRIRKWDGNYRNMAEDVRREAKGHHYTIMVLKSIPKMPGFLRTMAVTQTFASGYGAWQRRQDEGGR